MRINNYQPVTAFEYGFVNSACAASVRPMPASPIMSRELQRQAQINSGIDRMQTMVSALRDAALNVIPNGIVPPEVQRRTQVASAIADFRQEMNQFKRMAAANISRRGVTQMNSIMRAIETELKSFPETLEVISNGFVPPDLQRQSQVGTAIVRLRELLGDLKEKALSVR